MIKKLIQYRIAFIILLSVCSALLIEPPIHDDYNEFPPIRLYLLITTINLLIYLIPTDKLIFAEKLTYSILISFPALIVGAIIGRAIMVLIYGYDTNWDELKSPEIVDTALFYFSTALSGIGIFKIWLKYKKPIYPMR